MFSPGALESEQRIFELAWQEEAGDAILKENQESGTNFRSY